LLGGVADGGGHAGGGGRVEGDTLVQPARRGADPAEVAHVRPAMPTHGQV
jgi:hypothetical protein